MMSKLIIIRGNSGSGKSSVAKLVREGSKNPRRVALVEQDYLRRIVLKEKESDEGLNIELIKQTALFALYHKYDVIIEGILYSKRYRGMLSEVARTADKYYTYYLDVSFAETLQRHTTKPNAHEFGEKEMKEWYRNKDILGFENEVVLSENFTQTQLVHNILHNSGI